MSERAEELLAENCNLIIRKTHKMFRREDGVVYVIDTNLDFNFSDLRSLTQAGDTARDSYNADDGCKTCIIKHLCKPLPTVLTDTPKLKLIPAQKTSFQ